MRIIDHPEALHSETQRICAAIGMFDGVHLGHQQVIRRALHDAEEHEGISVAVTFDRHPNEIVAPHRAPPLIYTRAQRLRAIEAQGTDVALLLRFDEALSKTPPEAFIEFLAQGFGRLSSLSVGSGFRFGHKGKGNVALLEELGARLGFTVRSIASVSLDGEPVSSTRIRNAVRAGQFDVANQMLGRPYKLAGQVVAGDKVGRKLGFPTANLETTGLVLPSNGIYAAHAEVDGQVHRAVLNIGYRPTLHQPGDHPLVEAHLLDFSGDLYGKEMEIHFVEKLREEEKMESLEALKAQIASDIDAARRLFQ